MSYFRTLSLLFFSLFCISLNAQFFVGGNVGFNTTSNHEINNGNFPSSKASVYNLMLFPSVGKFLSEKIAVGVELNVSFSGSKTVTTVENISKYSTLGISPFVRYYVIKWNKFSLFGHGKVGIDFTNSTITSGGIISDQPKGTRLYFSVHPGISYDVNDKLLLQTYLSFLDLGYSYDYNKDIAGTSKNSSFTLGTGLNNIISFNAISIGGIYKF